VLTNPDKEDDMTDTDRTAAKRAPLTSLRKSALIAGAFYVLTFVSIPTLVLYRAVRGLNFIVGPGPDAPVILGAFLEMVVALAGIGTAVALYPVLKRQSEGRALGFVVSRVLEAATIYAGIVSLLSIVTLRQAGAGAGALVTGQALAAQYSWAFFFGQSFIPALNAVLLGSLLYQSRLVPRVLPMLGFIGAALLLAAWAATMLGLLEPGTVSPLAAFSAFPIALWEFSLGIYLLVKGFKPSPITAGM
jgi:hypothetical protein